MTDEQEGRSLPALELKTTRQDKLTIPKDFLGKWNVLYFYPKDDTPGCTKQACSYRDHFEKFKRSNVQVWGVSLDTVDSHNDFSRKFSLNFPLIADTDHKLSEALGVYGDQTWNQKTFKGLSRDTFLINPDGKVEKVWRKVDPESTVQEILNAISGLAK